MFKKIIVLLTSRKLYRQTEELANAYAKEMEYSQSVDEENQKLLERIQDLEDQLIKRDQDYDELQWSYEQLMNDNRSLECMNDMLEGELEYYKQKYDDIFDQDP